MTRANLVALAERLGGPSAADLAELERRLAFAGASLRHAFERRMKNWALGVGVVLCLSLGINAAEIWRSLRADAELRAKLASLEHVESALGLEVREPGENEDPPSLATVKSHVTGAREKLGEYEQMATLGIGHPETFSVGFYLGALLTGVLVSIGAPYLHDALRVLSAIRRRRDEEAGESAGGDASPLTESRAAPSGPASSLPAEVPDVQRRPTVPVGAALAARPHPGSRRPR